MFFKDMSNSLWQISAKFKCLKKQRLCVHNTDFKELVSQFNVLEMNNLIETSVLVEYEAISSQPNLKSILYIGADINAQARIIIHDYIRLLKSVGILSMR